MGGWEAEGNGSRLRTATGRGNGPEVRIAGEWEVYFIKAGHEQRHEGQADREVLSAAQEERTSEGRTP